MEIILQYTVIMEIIPQYTVIMEIILQYTVIMEIILQYTVIMEIILQYNVIMDFILQYTLTMEIILQYTVIMEIILQYTLTMEIILQYTVIMEIILTSGTFCSMTKLFVTIERTNKVCSSLQNMVWLGSNSLSSSNNMVYTMTCTCTPFVQLSQLSWEVVWGSRSNSQKRRYLLKPLRHLHKLFLYDLPSVSLYIWVNLPGRQGSRVSSR